MFFQWKKQNVNFSGQYLQKSCLFESHQLKANIEWISNYNIITDKTRLRFDILKTLFRILLLQMVSA